MLRSETGATLIIVTVMLPLLVVFASFALDISNWFVHKRHLQVQADAAALAGSSVFQVAGCDTAAIVGEARRYSGDPDGGEFNQQIGGAESRANVSFDLTAGNTDPCAANAVDVTMTEDDVPWYFRVAELAGGGEVRIRTRARVAMEQLDTLGQVVPLSIQDESITHVRAFLVDEDDPDVPLASQELGVVGSSGGFDTWSTTARPLSLPRVTQRRLGVRLAVSYGAGSSCANGADVTCYAKGLADGLIHVHGFERRPAVLTGAPDLQRAELVSCSGSPSPSFTTTTCQLRVRARVDWGNAVDADIADAAGSGGNCRGIARVRAKLGAGTPIDLDCKPSAPGEASVYEGDFTVPAGSGAAGLRLWYVQYEGRNDAGDECGSGQTPAGEPPEPDPCWGAFTDAVPAGHVETPGPGFAETAASMVNRVYGGSDALTDEIASASVTFSGGTQNGLPATAVTRCRPLETGCQAAFNVSVELPGPLKAGDDHDFDVAAPARRDHVIDCDPGAGGQGLEDAFAGGCTPTFGTRANRTCPLAGSFGSGLRQPWTCALSYAGSDGARATDGMTRRVHFGGGALGGAGTIDCSVHPDNWPDWQRDPDDPRIVPVLLAGRPLTRPGTPVMPVHDFAYFYVRGWGGNPCAQSAGGSDPDVAAGVIRGTFIKYVRRNDGGATGSGTPCDPSTMGGCLPVMTR